MKGFFRRLAGRRTMHGLLPLLFSGAFCPAAATPYSDINAAAASSSITSLHLRDDVSVLQGSGGNIGVFKGKSGLILVDSGISVSKAKIRAALREIDPGPIRYVINTHWHWDHTDGNAWLRRSGATVLADPRAIKRLAETNRIVEWEHTFTPVSRDALPNEKVIGNKSIRLGDETIHIRHYGAGHTDGDLSVYFTKADVLQTGDTFWNGVYPFIDYVSGGSIDGAIRSADTNLALATDRTLIIPGHGPVGSRLQLLEFRDMLVAIRKRIATLKAEHKSLDQVLAAHPTADYDAKWGKSVINGALFTRLVYRGL